jgi:hypothetical protein
MPGGLVADEMHLGKTFTSVAVAMLYKMVTETVVMAFPLSILSANTVAERVILVDNDFPSIFGEEREWYQRQRLNSIPRHLLQIHSTPPQGHPALLSAYAQILVVTIPGVTETFQTIIDKMTHGTDSKLVNWLNANVTHQDVNTSIEEPKNRWNIHLMLYDTLTSKVNP